MSKVTKHRMTVGRSSEDEYWGLNRYLQILEHVSENMYDYVEPSEIVESILEDFGESDEMERLRIDRLDTTDWHSFFSDLLALAGATHYPRVIFNLDTLMNNCADLNDDTLNFNKDISDALELSEKIKSERFLLKRKRNFRNRR